MLLIAFETSCDETSVAVVREGEVLSNVVASQVSLHSEYGGVVPELATREHLRNLPIVSRAALQEAGVGMADICGVAATLGPGLPQALLTGARMAAGLAMARGLPFLGVHHHEAHLYSPWIIGNPPRADFETFQPNVSLIASGGHTTLVYVRAELDHRVLGSTLDDAAGECFDKVAKLLGLPYPGGPMVDRLSVGGDPTAFDFPRPLLREPGDDFSFSGLKTSVRYLIQKSPGLVAEPARVRDLCASVQAAIVDVLVGKLVHAARRLGIEWVTASGGVTCNRAFRRQLASAAEAAGLEVRLSEPTLCTDNAAMVGIVAERRMSRGERTDYDVDVRPGWTL